MDPLEHAVSELRHQLNCAVLKKECRCQVPKLWKALDTLQTSEQTLCLLVLYKSPLWSDLPKEIKHMVHLFVASLGSHNPYAYLTANMYNAFFAGFKGEPLTDLERFRVQFNRADRF